MELLVWVVFEGAFRGFGGFGSLMLISACLVLVLLTLLVLGFSV